MGDRDEEVRRGQRAVLDPAAHVYPGPDIDLVTERRDAAHLSAEGAERQAAAWLDAIQRLPAR